MTLQVTPIYAGLLGLLMVVLAARVPMLRRRHRVSLGDGGSPELQVAVRVFGNFTEYVPMALLLLAVDELLGGPAVLLHGCGLLLLAARILHAVGLEAGRPGGWRMQCRAGGATLTFLVLAVESLASLVLVAYQGG